MIYERVDSEAPIRQGDIFRGIPRVDLSLAALPVVEDDETQRRISWKELLDESGDEAVTALLRIKPVDAIVITQSCDAARGEYLSLCQIDGFLQATGKKDPPKTANKWQKLITQHAKTNLRWFYLPADPHVGFAGPMAADFRVIIRVPREDLHAMRADMRMWRLNSDATEHFRESLAQFFRRYPYNEWYPLTKEEFQAYAESCPEPVDPYPWQQ